MACSILQAQAGRLRTFLVFKQTDFSRDFGEIGCFIVEGERVLPKRSSKEAVVILCDVWLDVLACARGRASQVLHSTITHWANKSLNMAALIVVFGSFPRSCWS